MKNGEKYVYVMHRGSAIVFIATCFVYFNSRTRNNHKSELREYTNARAEYTIGYWDKRLCIFSARKTYDSLILIVNLFSIPVSTFKFILFHFVLR